MKVRERFIAAHKPVNDQLSAAIESIRKCVAILGSNKKVAMQLSILHFALPTANNVEDAGVDRWRSQQPLAGITTLTDL